MQLGDPVMDVMHKDAMKPERAPIGQMAHKDLAGTGPTTIVSKSLCESTNARSRARTLSEWWLDDLSTQASSNRGDDEDEEEDFEGSADRTTAGSFGSRVRCRTLSEWYADSDGASCADGSEAAKSDKPRAPSFVELPRDSSQPNIIVAITIEGMAITFSRDWFEDDLSPAGDSTSPTGGDCVATETSMARTRSSEKEVVSWRGFWGVITQAATDVAASLACSR